MSLINDALKRLSHTPHTSAPPAKPRLASTLEPVAPTAPRVGVLAKLFGAQALLIVVAGGAWLIWRALNPVETGPLPLPVAPLNLAAEGMVPSQPGTDQTDVAPAGIDAQKHPLSPPATAGAQPGEWPELRLQAIFIRLSGSTARINGRTVATGDTIAGARLVAIQRDRVTVEWQGQRKTLPLGSVPQEVGQP